MLQCNLSVFSVLALVSWNSLPKVDCLDEKTGFRFSEVRMQSSHQYSQLSTRVFSDGESLVFWIAFFKIWMD
jgi:hypothetical protein